MWMMGGFVALLGFFVVLWLTEPVAPPIAPGLTILTNATVSDATSLMAAVQSAGLSGTPDVRGAIEEIKRNNDERVMIKGWVVDATASDALQTVIVYAGGRHVLTTMATRGARFDIAKAIGISDTGAPVMTFHGDFACKPGEKLIVVTVTSDRRYSQFRSLVCP